jgi:4-amino-4-deoxy-L-arabinose transferase-like glycosyltransferase
MLTSAPIEDSSRLSSLRTRIPALLIALAGLNWAFQVVWFWRYCGRNINADAISYIGIARHLADGNPSASLHGYWSPLISWLIAAVSLFGGNRTLAARLLMLAIFALCLALMYRLTQKLWNSRLLSALVVLWFTAARGMAAFSVCFIGADLLLTSAVLVYFILLLGCMEEPENLRKWLLLGVAHGIAFLAKAFAMPLFALVTPVSVLVTYARSPKKAAQALLLAAVFPALMWAGWGTALRQRYGVFTTGYQLRWNLVDPAVRKQAFRRNPGLLTLQDMSATYDPYMATAAIAPEAEFWHARVWRPALVRQVVRKEIQNVPRALKELLVLLTPGGVLALVLCVSQLTLSRRHGQVRFRFAGIVLLTTATLVLGYCMLVFDGRYVIPVTPILMALGIRFALPPGRTKDLPLPGVERIADAGRWQTAAGTLIVVGLIVSQVYWASPFRTIRQDFQQSLHNAESALRIGQARNIVAIGTGPYPEQGVGWEASLYTAYYADARIIAGLFEVPPGLSPESVVIDIGRLAPDAVLIWGTPSHSEYSALVNAVRETNPTAGVSSIQDPVKGEVGTILILKKST